MAIPRPTHSATVDVGIFSSIRRSYLASYYPSSTYAFSRGSTRWLALFQFPYATYDPVTNPETLGMWKSDDDGATWTEVDAANSPIVNSGGFHVGGAYDFAFGPTVDPSTPHKLTVLFSAPDTSPGALAGTIHDLYYADFDFFTETWGSPYGHFAIPSDLTTSITVGAEFSVAPDGSYAYAYRTTALGSVVGGVPAGGESPSLVVDSTSTGHYGGTWSRTGNVVIIGGRIVFPRINSGIIEVLSRAVGDTAWTTSVVLPSNGLTSGAASSLWLYRGTTIYWCGNTGASLYRSTYGAGEWGPAELIWSAATDANPDVDPGAGPGDVLSPCISVNANLGGVDVTLETGLTSGSFDGLITFHLDIFDPNPPDGTVGTPYSYFIPFTGLDPLTFSSSGTLPPGLIIDPPTGQFSGVPTTPGPFGFTITVTDGAGNSFSKFVIVTITGASGGLARYYGK